METVYDAYLMVYYATFLLKEFIILRLTVDYPKLSV